MDEYTTLISAFDLLHHSTDAQWVVVDARFSLVDFELGRRKYREGHISGAVFADLNQDLAAPHVPGVTGRHPLPPIERVVSVFSRLGIGPETQVIAYDDMGGALAAVRVWWMLRWLGHTRVAVLDGGWQAWQSAGYPVRSGEEGHAPQYFVPYLRPELIVTSDQVDVLRQDATHRLLDARTFERFRGENETIDPVAGHIPGAVSAPYAGNLTPEGRFRPPEELRRRYEKLLAGVPAGNSIVYCGSGVTSIHNLLAMQHAGLGEGRLYVGSWSEWIVDPSRPVATGPD